MIDWKRVQGVVFDLDGTLIDSMEIWQEVDEEFFKRRNMAVPAGYQERIAHLGFRECAAYTKRAYLPEESEEAIIAEWRTLSLRKYAAEDAIKYFKPYALALVRNLHAQGIRMSIATASSPEFFLPILRSGGIIELFDGYTTVDEVGKNKSYPDIYWKSAEKMNVAPERCVVFEDNLLAVRAARQAGMQTAAVYDEQTKSTHEALLREADAFIETFEEILRVNSAEGEETCTNPNSV